jgi:hypothetical protein
MKRPDQGSAPFYTRDSGGRHEMTPAAYVTWARTDAIDRGLRFSGTPEQITRMIQEGRFAEGDIFVDFDVKGNVLTRNGLDALIEKVAADKQISHVYIPWRDRLARPDNPLDGMKLEQRFLDLGVTLVFTDKIIAPTPRGKRTNVSELIASVLDYDTSGKFRRDLAHKIILAQISLAEQGYSTGGRPPYGFRRWLVKVDGTRIRQLAEGERIRMAGHHVVWLPGPHEELQIIRRILAMLEIMPASRVAAMLTAEGVPTPDVDRYRTDGGVRHKTSGVWHAPTVINIARNPLLTALATYGRRSMGDQLRISSSGPRPLTDADFRADCKPKVIANSKSDQVIADAHFEPIVTVESHERLIAILDARGGTQRGKPRSRDPNQNPLGGRIFDIDCKWPMYRGPYKDSFRYVCGFYMQSHGAHCSHNWIDGPLAVQFTLSCLKQRMFTLKGKLEDRLRQLATRDAAGDTSQDEARRLEHQLALVEKDLGLAETNLARADSDEQFKAISARFNELAIQKKAIKNHLAIAQANRQPRDVESEVISAMSAARRLADLPRAGADLAAVTRLFQVANPKLYLRFGSKLLKKRSVNRVDSGVLTLGDAPAPIAVYQGPTARNKLAATETSPSSAVGQNEFQASVVTSSGMEGQSLGNTNRGDRI